MSPSCSHNLACALQCAGLETLAVTRKAAGSYGGDGYYTPGTSSVVSVQAHVQPAGPKDLETVPDALRARKNLALWSTVVMYTAIEKGQSADAFTYRGERFEVHQVTDWSSQGGFYKSLAVMVDET